MNSELNKSYQLMSIPWYKRYWKTKIHWSSSKSKTIWSDSKWNGCKM